jgi:Skp family chaperone for outer membrane proteins
MKRIMMFSLLCLITATLQAADRFAPVNPNASYQEMQNRAEDSSSVINYDYITTNIIGTIQKEMRDGQQVIDPQQQAIANSVIIQPGASTGDIYVNIQTEGDTYAVAPGR